MAGSGLLTAFMTGAAKRAIQVRDQSEAEQARIAQEQRAEKVQLRLLEVQQKYAKEGWKYKTDTAIAAQNQQALIAKQAREHQAQLAQQAKIEDEKRKRLEEANQRQRTAEGLKLLFPNLAPSDYNSAASLSPEMQKLFLSTKLTKEKTTKTNQIVDNYLSKQAELDPKKYNQQYQNLFKAHIALGGKVSDFDYSWDADTNEWVKSDVLTERLKLRSAEKKAGATAGVLKSPIYRDARKEGAAYIYGVINVLDDIPASLKLKPQFDSDGKLELLGGNPEVTKLAAMLYMEMYNSLLIGRPASTALTIMDARARAEGFLNYTEWLAVAAGSRKAVQAVQARLNEAQGLELNNQITTSQAQDTAAQKFQQQTQAGKEQDRLIASLISKLQLPSEATPMDIVTKIMNTYPIGQEEVPSDVEQYMKYIMDNTTDPQVKSQINDWFNTAAFREPMFMQHENQMKEQGKKFNENISKLPSLKF